MAEVDIAQFKDVLIAHKKRTLEVFLQNASNPIPPDNYESQRIKILCKINDEYGPVKDLPPPVPAPRSAPAAPAASTSEKAKTAERAGAAEGSEAVGEEEPMQVLPAHPIPVAPGVALTPETALPVPELRASAIEKVVRELPRGREVQSGASVTQIARRAGGAGAGAEAQLGSRALVALSEAPSLPRPEWHPPWKLMRVISGHLGWVRSVAVDVSNKWFATGSADRTIKIWDLASGTLKLTLTGHINAVRGLAISDRHPYLFSVGEDKMARCWDLEYNKVVRHYHGHLSGIYCCTLHPTIDLFITGGRDSSARVWDIRTKAQIHCLTGHTNTVASVAAQGVDPQVITGSHDQTVRLWDLVAGRTATILTHHKKSIRALQLHPSEFTFVSAAADNLKHWKLPEARFIKNFSGHNAVVNTVALNRDNVLVSGADNGSMYFWDWRSGYNFQQVQSRPQPGSLESEAGVFALAFDHTGSRLISCEADKTIKIYAEDETATPETHPITGWNPSKVMKRY